MPPTFDAQAFEKDVAQILTALDAAQQQALTTQTQELAARINALSTKVSDQQLHIDALQKQLDAQNDLIAKLDGVIDRLENDITALKKARQRTSATPIAMPAPADVEAEPDVPDSSATQHPTDVEVEPDVPVPSATQHPTNVEAAIAAFQRSPGYQELERYWASKPDDKKSAQRTAVEKVFTHLKACTTTASPAAIQFALTFFCIRAARILDRKPDTFTERMPVLLNAPGTATADVGGFAIDPNKKKRVRVTDFWAVDDAKEVFKDASAPFISFFGTEKAALQTLIDALEKSAIPEGTGKVKLILWNTLLEPAFNAIRTLPAKEGHA
jgi:uncharacterized coiled-coil protein SlyX